MCQQAKLNTAQHQRTLRKYFEFLKQRTILIKVKNRTSYVRNSYLAVHCSSLPPEYEDLLDCTPSKPGVIQASGPAQVYWDSLYGNQGQTLFKHDDDGDDDVGGRSKLHQNNYIRTSYGYRYKCQ